MRWLGALLLCIVLAAPAMAVPDVEFRTLPGQARGSVVVNGVQRELTIVQDGPLETRFRTPGVEGADMTIVLQRTNFDDATLSVRWNVQAEKWERVRGSVPFLEPSDVIAFPKTLRINTFPSDVQISEDSQQPQQRRVRVGGVEYSTVPLSRTADGRVVIAGAYRPAPLVLERPLFEPQLLVFKEGELDAPGAVFPAEAIRMRPLYGPFSYWQVNVGGAAAALVGLVVWLGILRPRAIRRRREEKRTLNIATQIVEQTENLEKGGALPPLLGQRLRTDNGSEFVVLRPIGEGGMGAVFEAASPSGEEWAVKVLFSDAWTDEDFRGRFQREVHICSTLVHPGIVKVLDSGLYSPGDGDKSWPFMVMERVKGEELRALIADGRARKSPLSRVLGWAMEALAALRTAHAAGIVHRDLKPENLMLTSAGHIKILDFGVARQMDRKSLTQTGRMMGSPVYMSPEHLDAKRVSTASDVYSMGVILYELLTGVPPFYADDAWSVVMKMLQEEPRPIGELRADLPSGLDAVVMRMLAKNPADRYATVVEVQEALEPVVRGLS